MNVKLDKESDNLDFDGELTAACYNKKEGLIVINQFRLVPGENSQQYYINSLRFYRLRLGNWLWLEFLEEKDSTIHNSN